jgi:hypothetical protein
MPADELHKYRRKYPQVLGAVLMACVLRQAELIAEIFHDQYAVLDDDIKSACYTLARCGYTPDMLDPHDKEALKLFALCYNAAADARQNRRQAAE